MHFPKISPSVWGMSLVMSTSHFAVSADDTITLIDTSRPSFTETVNLIPPNSIQWESGMTYIAKRGTARQLNAPELLLRYGLTDRVELRTFLPQAVARWGGDASETEYAMSDMMLGAKVALGHTGIVQWTGLAGVSLPVGTNGRQSSGAFDPSVAIIYSVPIGDKLSLTGQSSMDSGRTPTHRQEQFQQTAMLGYAFNERWVSYGEYTYQGIEREGNNHILLGGVEYRLTPRIQVDARVGSRLGPQGDSLFVGVGLSARMDRAQPRTKSSL
jgi:hypothetical protein